MRTKRSTRPKAGSGGGAYGPITKAKRRGEGGYNWAMGTKHLDTGETTQEVRGREDRNEITTFRRADSTE